MTRGNSDEIATPSRRALLKAAAAGGAFAVPLIASFSMDGASAQTTVNPFGSSNQHHSSNQTYSSNQFISSNMYCSNMTVHSTTFHAELHHAHGGPGAGMAGLEFHQGRDEIFYELVLDGRVQDWSLDGPGLVVSVTGGPKVGTIHGSSLECSVSAVYAALETGRVQIHIDLGGGKQVTGTFTRPRPHGPGGDAGWHAPNAHSFGFLGQG
jgi:hypothetical protein